MKGSMAPTPPQLRQEAYQAVLNGAYAGEMFGNNAILAFSAKCCDTMGKTWQSQLNSPGTLGREYLGRLMRSREHWKMVPDLSHAVVTSGYGSGWTLTTTSRTSDGQTIIAYVPTGSSATLTVDMSKITSSSKEANCWWYNPRDGRATLIGAYANTGSHNFTPPDSNDWALVIDAADAYLAAWERGFVKITHPLFEMHRPIDDNLVGRYQVDPQSRHASYPSPPTSREGKSGMLIEVQFTRKICRKLIDIVSLGGYSRPGMADHGEANHQ